MTAANISGDITIHWYLAVLRERWRCLVAGLVVGTLLAGAYLVVVGRTATARTVVSVNVIATSPFDRGDSASNLIDTVTEVEYAKSYEVARRASELLGDTSAREIRDNTAVMPIADATVLDITYSSDTASAARRGANAVSQAYLDYRSEIAQQRIDAGLAGIDVRTDVLRTELDELNAGQADATPGSTRAIQLEVDRSVALTALNSLLAQRFDLERIDTTPGAIISPAEENHVAYAPSRKMLLGAGVFGGLLMGGVFAFVRNVTDRRVRSVRQVTSVLGARQLGQLDVIDVTGPEVLDRGDLRATRAELALELPSGTDTLVAVDLTQRDRGVTVPLALAASFAQISEPASVLVVGASEHSRDDLIERLGLTATRNSQRDPVYRTPISSRLRILFVDGEGGRAQLSAAGERATSARPRGSDEGPVITWIVVAPEARDDIRTVAVGASKSLIVVAALGVTSRDDVVRVVEHCERSGSHALGVVTTTP